MYKVYDNVWIMQDNKICEKMVYSVTESMGHLPSETCITICLVNEFCSNNTSTNPAVGYDLRFIFNTKEELIESLLK